MSEGFEQYHVPQQSRRDKLRVVNTSQGCVDYVPLYDPSDLLTCSAANLHHHRQSFNLDPNKDMGFSHMYGNSPNLNPSCSSSSTIQDHISISSAQFMYNTSPNQNYRAVLDEQQSFHYHGSNSTNNVVVGYKPHESLSTMVNGGQSLSLSLSSHNTQNSNTNTVPLELNSVFGSGNKVNNNEGFFVTGNGVELSRSSVPLGPFTGYATVLKKSRFLKPAQQLLEELCDGGGGRGGVYGEKIAPDSALMEPPILLSGNEVVDDQSVSFSDGSEQIRKKSRLLSMLDEVYKRYKLYYQQMQAVVSSFESVAGLSNAAPFASLALKSLSKHFKCLKNTITEQLQCTIKYHGKANYEGDEPQRLENSGMGPPAQRPFHNTRFVDQPVWRPQRGLPERAVSVLRAWLFEHFLHPYPTDTDKMMLAKQTGLSRNQVSNWFINARVRLWKPMVEEIHMLETHQSQKQPQREEPSANRLNDHLPTSSSVECENASTSFQGIGEFPLKRSREELTETPGGSNRPMNLPYENLSHHPHLGGAGVGNSGVSLTLGLHQNSMGLPDNGMGLSESYPINAARRFGLDAHGEGYMLSGFAAQNRQYG